MAVQNFDVVGAARAGEQYRVMRDKQIQQQQDEKLLRDLSPKIQAGDPAAYGQAAAVNPEGANAALGAGDTMARRAEGLIKMLEQADTSNPQAAQALWQQYGVPFARQFSQGNEPTANWAEAKPMVQQLKARIEMAKGQAQGVNVQSTQIGADGYYYTVDRAGNWTNSGVKADPRVQFRDVPGIAPGIVNLREGTITPVGASNAATNQQAPPMSEEELHAFATQMSRANVPAEQIEAWLQSKLSAPRGVDQGGSPVQIPDGAQLPPANGAAQMRPAIDPGEAARLDIANRADRRAEEANARAAQAAQNAARGNAPAGFRFKADGSLEPIPGGPKPAGAAASEDERKAAAWLAQAENAYKNMQSVLQGDERADDPGFIETYVPWDEAANLSRSDTRQQYVQAAASLSEALLRAATGAGITRDEALQKIRELTPQRGDSDAVKAQKLQAIPVYIQALRQRAGRAAPEVNNSRGPQVGAVEDGYRYKGGDPANPSNWEQVR